MKNTKIYKGKIPLVCYPRDAAKQYVSYIPDYDIRKFWYYEDMEKGDAIWKELEWIDNFEFSGEVKIDGYSRGRSAANFNITILRVSGIGINKEYKWIEGFTATMFMTDIMDVISFTNIDGGKFKGTFTFCKRGSNYGIRMIL